MNIETKKISIVRLILLIFIPISIFLFGFKNQKINETNEYLSIHVIYKGKTQLFLINEQSQELKKLAIVPPKAAGVTKKKWHKRGFKILKDKVQGGYDNSYVFKLLNQYEAEGWKLNSHSMGLTIEESTFTSGTAKEIQYVMTRKK